MAKIRDYYDYVSWNTWSCSVCNKELKAHNTSSLLKHFRNLHPENFNDYLKIAARIPMDEGPCPVNPKKLNKEQVRKESMSRPLPNIVTSSSTLDDTAESTDYEWEGYEEENSQEENTTIIDPEIERIPEDPLKLFFMTMYAATKKLPRQELFRVRTKIYEIVTEAEQQQYNKRTA